MKDQLFNVKYNNLVTFKKENINLYLIRSLHGYPSNLTFFFFWTRKKIVFLIE
jgi:hypothetical protein